MRLGILGGGRAAWAFGSSWRRAGLPVTGCWVRPSSPSRLAELLAVPRRSLEELASDCDLLLLAVSDRSLEEVAAAVPSTGARLFHASGGISASVLGDRQPAPFSLHPLRALRPAPAESDLTGSLLVFEGAEEARTTAQEVASLLGCRFAKVASGTKALYHAAAVFGANDVAALLELASALFVRAGVEEISRHDVADLARSAIDNWERQRGIGRFTGPAVRGDEDVLESHLKALGNDTPEAVLYRILAERLRAAVKDQALSVEE